MFQSICSLIYQNWQRLIILHYSHHYSKKFFFWGLYQYFRKTVSLQLAHHPRTWVKSILRGKDQWVHKKKTRLVKFFLWPKIKHIGKAPRVLFCSNTYYEWTYTARGFWAQPHIAFSVLTAFTMAKTAAELCCVLWIWKLTQNL